MKRLREEHYRYRYGGDSGLENFVFPCNYGIRIYARLAVILWIITVKMFTRSIITWELLRIRWHILCSVKSGCRPSQLTPHMHAKIALLPWTQVRWCVSWTQVRSSLSLSGNSSTTRIRYGTVPYHGTAVAGTTTTTGYIRLYGTVRVFNSTYSIDRTSISIVHE